MIGGLRDCSSVTSRSYVKIIVRYVVRYKEEEGGIAVAMPTYDDAADGLISGNYCICERDGTLASKYSYLLTMREIRHMEKKKYLPTVNRRSPIVVKQTELCNLDVATREDIRKTSDMPHVDYTVSTDCRRSVTPEVYYGQGRQCLVGGEVYPPLLKSLPLTAKECQEGLIVRDCSIYRMSSKGEYSQVTNFCVEFEALVLEVDLQSEIVKILIKVKWDKSTMKILLPLEKFDQLYSLIHKNAPELIVYSPVDKNRQLFNQHAANEYGSVKDTLRRIVIHVASGWRKEFERMRYFSCENEDILCENEGIIYLGKKKDKGRGICLPQSIPYAHSHLAEWCIGLLDLSNQNIMVPLLIQFHLGYMARLFADAGEPIQHILTIIGPTGSKKTSVAEVLFCLFGLRKINFTSTNRAIELNMMACHDANMLLDDLSLSNDKIQCDKFENILRQIGDSAGRARSAKSGTVQEFVDTSVAITVTAETELDGLQQSSKLRTPAIFVDKSSFNTEVLSKYQKEAKLAEASGGYSLLEYYIATFILYLVENYEKLVQMIAIDDIPEFPTRFARLRRLYSIYLKAIRIIIGFWQYCGAVYYEAIDVCNIDVYLSAIQQMVRANEIRCSQEDPDKMFLMAVVDGVASGALRLADSQKQFVANPYDWIGFRDGNFVKLNPVRVYEYVLEYYRGIGLKFTESMNGILRRLCDNGYSEGYKQKGDHKAKPLKEIIINKASLRILCLRWDVVVKEVTIVKEGENDNGYFSK